MDIIVPAAGLSTRFPNLPPKYILRDANNCMMLRNAINPFLDKHRIVVGVLSDHVNKYDVVSQLRNEFSTSIEVVILGSQTNGPADTVNRILQLSGNLLNSIFIKDTDSFFDHVPLTGNYVCLHTSDDLTPSKSYVRIENDNITDIAEKQIISAYYCVGGYKFKSAAHYQQFYSYASNNGEQFVSHVIKQALLYNNTFKPVFVTNYVDVGMLADWETYQTTLMSSNHDHS